MHMLRSMLSDAKMYRYAGLYCREHGMEKEARAYLRTARYHLRLYRARKAALEERRVLQGR
jgi:hypothetical protein